MQTEPNPSAAADRDHLIHEQRLAAALRELLQQIDLGDYRDQQGHAARENPAFRAAQALVERFGLTHEQLAATLGDADLSGDLTEAARRLQEPRRTASPSDVPPEYNTWHTGP